MSNSKKTSIKNLYNSMRDALDNGDNFSWLINKCHRQSSLASIERKNIGIQSMSLNTFKIHANDCIEGGFDKIDYIRKEIHHKYKNQKPKKNINKKSKIYKHKLEEAERYRAILIRAYNDLNNICLDAVKKTPEYQYDLDRHNELYSRYFSLALVKDNE